ncbi:prepilin peptidase [Microbacterium arborescens]|uniref:prepilin peptidase n=1 Tax=Microbacterium arborescens TaxID=33883 RepID=UPI003C7612A0
MTVVGAAALVLSVVCAALSLGLSLIDIATHRLPNRLVLALAVAASGSAALTAIDRASTRPLIGAVVAGAALFALYLLLHAGRGGMGGGDVKLAGAIGLLTGPHGWEVPLVATGLAFVLGGLLAVVLMTLRRADRRTRLPFGPFMLVGAWVALAGSFVAG